MPDQLDSVLFLDLLTGGEAVTFQTFDDSKAKRKTLNKVMHGSLSDHSGALESLNERGAGIFVMVNAGDFNGRKAENIQRVRAVFVDLDGSPIEPVVAGPLQPHVVVESSPHRYHAYWLTNGLDRNEFRAFQEMLAQRFDGDPVVKDLSRVMRLPGYLHKKDEPYLTHILSADDRPRYGRFDLIDAFGFDPASIDWRERTPIPEGKRNSQLFRMACGFVNKGFAGASIFERLCSINETRCKPPLPDAELRQIVESASRCGSGGAVSIDYRLMDSKEYKALSPMARALDMAIRRITNGSREAIISLLPNDLAQWGFGNRKTLAKYREELIENGFLSLHRAPRYGQQGETRECGLYRLADPVFMAERATNSRAVSGKPYSPNVVHSS